MSNEEILGSQPAPAEYSRTFEIGEVLSAMDLARQDAREQVINELVGWMEEQSSVCWVREPSADEVFTRCITHAKSLLNQQGPVELKKDDYWKQRCLLAEKCLSVSPCDPDITKEQISAHNAYDQFIKSNQQGEETKLNP